MEYEYDTNLVGILKFRNGAIGKTSTSLDVKSPYAFNVDLLGDKGSIRDNKIFAAEFFGGQTDWIEVPTIRPDNGDVAHHPFDGELRHFIDTISSGIESPLNLDDAAKTHAVCYALERSSSEGRTVRLFCRRDHGAMSVWICWKSALIGGGGRFAKVPNASRMGSQIFSYC